MHASEGRCNKKMEELEFYKEWCLIMYDYACSCFINDTIGKNEILDVQKDFEKMKSDILKFYKNGNLKKIKRMVFICK